MNSKITIRPHLAAILGFLFFISCSASKEVEEDQKEKIRIDETEIYYLKDAAKYDSTGNRERIIREIQEIFPAEYYKDNDTNYVFMIQIGAFKNIKRAESLANSIPQKFDVGKEIEFMKNSGFYIVYLGPFLTKTSAQDIADQLISDKIVTEAIILKRDIN